MTVSSSTNKVSFNGDGSTTVFAYSFKVFDESDLTVILRASDGTETTQTITTNYTVSGVGDAGGGNVTMVTAPASGEQLTILREQPLTQGLDLVPNDPFPANSIEDSLDKLTFMVQQHQEELDRSIKASKTTTINTVEFVESAATRANKVFAFDGSGELDLTQEIGTFQGDWAASTAYAVRDIVKDTNNNNIYIANTAHTSSGTVPLTGNADIAKWDLLVDAAAATTSANNAATSATAAATSATAAATSATAAATSESNAATSASNASTSETNAAASATNAATSESNAAGSESAAATSETNAATSATSASTSASAAATSATNAATSESNASTSQSAAAASATAAATSATSAATNATNAATSATNASTAQTAAETAQTAAEAAQAAAELAADNFDDTYLGSKSSDPTVDNDGGALNAGDLYFNTTSNTLKVYSGSAWQDAAVDSSGFVQTTGDTMTGNLDVQGTVTADGLTVDGDARFTGTLSTLNYPSSLLLDYFPTVTGTRIFSIGPDASTEGQFEFHTSTTSTNKKRLSIASGGDISFYEDTGTTAKFFWDASAESLGIGTSSPAYQLDVQGTGNSRIRVKNTSVTGEAQFHHDGNGDLYIKNSVSGRNQVFFNDGAERMRIDSSGNVGIGVIPVTKLDVQSSSGIIGRIQSTSGDAQFNIAVPNVNDGILAFGDASAYRASIKANTSDALTFQTGSSLTERMRIDSSGNLLVGTTSTALHTQSSNTGSRLLPSGAIHTAVSSDVHFMNRLSTDGDIIRFQKDGTTVGSIGTAGGDTYVGSSTTGVIFTDSVDAMIARSPSAPATVQDGVHNLGWTNQRWKDLYLSGDTFVGEPSTIGAGETGVTVRGLGQIRVGRAGTASVTLVSFNNNNGEVGRISTSGSATSYVTSSDYRLKENVVDLTGATDRIKQIPVHRFNFIADPDTTVDGFLAHEVQDIVPEAVTGAKDAMRDEEYEVTPAVLDDDGNVVTEAVMGTRSVPDYQGIDQSKLVPLLVATIKELEARITALEAN